VKGYNDLKAQGSDFKAPDGSNADEMNEFYDKLGRPETPDDYDFDNKSALTVFTPQISIIFSSTILPSSVPNTLLYSTTLSSFVSLYICAIHSCVFNNLRTLVYYLISP
jgi:hypothetical protein